MMSADDFAEDLGEELASVLEHHFHQVNVEELGQGKALQDLEDRMVRLLARLLPQEHPHYPGDPVLRHAAYAPMPEEPWTLGRTHPDYIPQPAGPRWREQED